MFLYNSNLPFYSAASKYQNQCDQKGHICVSGISGNWWSEAGLSCPSRLVTDPLLWNGGWGSGGTVPGEPEGQCWGGGYNCITPSPRNRRKRALA